MTPQEIDDLCFSKSEELVASVFAHLSHRDKLKLTLMLADPIHKIVAQAFASAGRTVVAPRAPATTPAAPRVRRTKAQIEADRIAAATATLQGATPATTPFVPPLPPAPRAPVPPVTTAESIPATSPFAAPPTFGAAPLQPAPFGASAA